MSSPFFVHIMCDRKGRIILNRFAIDFFKCGIAGWCLEVIFTSAESVIAGDWRLMGHTSLLMFPIYGMGALLGPIGRQVDLWIGDGSSGAGTELNPADQAVRHGMLYMVLIFIGEYVSGLFLRGRGMCPWDYTGCRSSVNGLIRLDFAPFWFLTGLLFEQITGVQKR